MFTNEKINEIMKQAQQIQKKMEEIQKNINIEKIKGKSGVDLVEVTMYGNYNCESIKISEEIWNERNKTLLQDLIVSAINDAVKKITELQKKKLSLESSLLKESNK